MKKYNRTHTIALADDAPLSLLSMEHIINSMPGVQHIFSANDGDTLITYLQSVEAQPDICILDIGMKEMNGFATLSLIKHHWPDIRNIIVTAYTREVYVQKMMRLGADAFLSKSSEREEIIRAIDKVITCGKYYSGSFTKQNQNALLKKYTHDNNLRPNEEILLTLIGKNYTYEQIGEKMFLSKRTVEGLRDSLFLKTKVNTRQELVEIAIKFGYVLLLDPVNPLKEHTPKL